MPLDSRTREGDEALAVIGFCTVRKDAALLRGGGDAVDADVREAVLRCVVGASATVGGGLALSCPAYWRTNAGVF